MGSRWNRRLGCWIPSGDAPTQAELDKYKADSERAIEAERERFRLATAPIAHPTIAAPRHKCYRAIRYVKRNGLLDVEDIGWARSPVPLHAIINREIGRARIIDPNNKVYADNLHPIEERA
jgi:hypothetical protein